MTKLKYIILVSVFHKCLTGFGESLHQVSRFFFFFFDSRFGDAWRQTWKTRETEAARCILPCTGAIMMHNNNKIDWRKQDRRWRKRARRAATSFLADTCDLVAGPEILPRQTFLHRGQPRSRATREAVLSVSPVSRFTENFARDAKAWQPGSFRDRGRLSPRSSGQRQAASRRTVLEGERARRERDVENRRAVFRRRTLARDRLASKRGIMLRSE